MPARAIIGRAPGKVLWLGGYSVMEMPNIGVVSAVDAYAEAAISANGEGTVELSAPQLGKSARGTLDKDGSMRIEVPPELLLLKTAAELSARYAAGTGAKAIGFSVTTHTDAGFSYDISGGGVVKSGLGSSAAVAVATVKAVLEMFGVDPVENEALHKLSQVAHSMAAGKVGSGFDVAAAVHGSIVYTRYSPEILGKFPHTNAQLVDLVKSRWDYSVRKLVLPDNMSLLAAAFGSSMMTTKAARKVSDFRITDPYTYGSLMGSINDQNVLALKALEKARTGSTDALEGFREAFDRGRSLTKKLGLLSGVEIEPDDCTALIEESKENGAFVAKLPGAGGRDSIAALCTDNESRERLRKFWLKKKELTVLDLGFAVGGVL